MTRDAYLAEIVHRLGFAIEREPDHAARHKLKEARDLVRDVLWGTDAARPTPDVVVPDPAPAPESDP